MPWASPATGVVGQFCQGALASPGFVALAVYMPVPSPELSGHSDIGWEGWFPTPWLLLICLLGHSFLYSILNVSIFLSTCHLPWIHGKFSSYEPLLWISQSPFFCVLTNWSYLHFSEVPQRELSRTRSLIYYYIQLILLHFWSQPCNQNVD